MTENKGAGSIVSHLELPVDSYRPSLTQTQTILLSMGNRKHPFGCMKCCQVCIRAGSTRLNCVTENKH